MGDIVSSRELDDVVRENATRALQSAFDRINTDHIGSIMAPFGMVRGDGFEGVMLTQSYAPRIVQDIIKALYRADRTTARISVVLGQLTITSDDRNVADGPAFHRALDILAKMKERKSTHWLQVSFEIGPMAQALVDSQLALLAALTEGWTDKQREIVWLTEAHGGMQKTVGKKLGISPSVVNKQLKAANYDAYRGAWDGLTDYLEKMDEFTVKDEPDDKNYLAYYNVARHKIEQENFNEALFPAKKALTLAINELGNGDMQLIPIYNMMAEIYMRLNEYDLSDELINESVRIQDSMPKTRVPYVETALLRAQLSYFIKEYKLAINYFKEAERLANDFLDNKHPLFTEIYNDLANVYYEQGEIEEAMANYTKAIEYIGGEKNQIAYATILFNISNCYFKLGKLANAISFMEDASQIYKENLHPKHDYNVLVNRKLLLYKEAAAP